MLECMRLGAYQQISLFFKLAIFLLWSKGREILASLLSICIHLGLSLCPFNALYGGEPIGEGIPEPVIINIPLNVLVFFALFFLQTFVLLLLLKERINPKGKIRQRFLYPFINKVF